MFVTLIKIEKCICSQEYSFSISIDKMTDLKIKQVIISEPRCAKHGHNNWHTERTYYVILDDKESSSYEYIDSTEGSVTSDYFYHYKRLFIDHLDRCVYNGWTDDLLELHSPYYKNCRFRLYKTTNKFENDMLLVDVIGDEMELNEFLKNKGLYNGERICWLNKSDYLYKKNKDPKYICGEIDLVKNNVDIVSTKLKLVEEENDKLKKKVDDMEKLIDNMNNLLIAFGITNR